MSIRTTSLSTTAHENLVVLVGETDYLCVVNEQGFEDLRKGAEFETELLNKDTKDSLGKRVNLRIKDFSSGEADTEMIPEDASFDDAEKVRLSIDRRLYERSVSQGFCSRRWAYGDVIILRVDDEELPEYRGK